MLASLHTGYVHKASYQFVPVTLWDDCGIASRNSPGPCWHRCRLPDACMAVLPVGCERHRQTRLQTSCSSQDVGMRRECVHGYSICRQSRVEVNEVVWSFPASSSCHHCE